MEESDLSEDLEDNFRKRNVKVSYINANLLMEDILRKKSFKIIRRYIEDFAGILNGVLDVFPKYKQSAKELILYFIFSSKL